MGVVAGAEDRMERVLAAQTPARGGRAGGASSGLRGNSERRKHGNMEC